MSAGVYDVLIVGAGIVGAACAAALSSEGLRVAIAERDIVAGGATAAGMGHLVVMDDSEAQFALTRYSRQLWMNVAAELPAQVEYRQCGTLWIAADEEEMAEIRRKHLYYSDRSVRTEIVDPETLARLEPNLRSGLAGALLVLEDATIYPPCAAAFLIERACDRGVQLLLGKSVHSAKNGSVRFTDGDEISAGIIVIAAGASAPDIIKDIELRLRKGHLVITDRHPGFVQHQLIELGYLKSAHSQDADSVAFNVQPRATGQILIGSSRQYGVEDSRVDVDLLHRMLYRAFAYMPALAGTSTLRTWTGFRAATPDKLPLIGPWSEDETLFLATGHEGLGITTSLGTAALLTDQILGRPSRIPCEPYLPSRVITGQVHV